MKIAIVKVVVLLIIHEPHHEKNLSLQIPTRSNRNLPEQQQKMARGLKFQILESVRGLHYIVKTKALISRAVTA